MSANIINDQYRYRYWYNTCMVQLIRVYFCICICVSSIESESSLAHLVLGSLCFNGHYITRQQFRRLKDLFHHQPRSTESSILLWWPIYYHKIWVSKRLSITISHWSMNKTKILEDAILSEIFNAAVETFLATIPALVWRHKDKEADSGTEARTQLYICLI